MHSGRTSSAIALLVLTLGVVSPAGGGFLIRMAHLCPARAVAPGMLHDPPGDHDGHSSRGPTDGCHCVGDCHAPGVLPERAAPGPAGFAPLQEPLPRLWHVAEAPVALPLDRLPPATAPPHVVRT